MNTALFYLYGDDATLVRYFDSDQGGDQDETNEMEYVFYLVSISCSWTSKRHALGPCLDVKLSM